MSITRYVLSNQLNFGISVFQMLSTCGVKLPSHVGVAGSLTGRKEHVRISTPRKSSPKIWGNFIPCSRRKVRQNDWDHRTDFIVPVTVVLEDSGSSLFSLFSDWLPYRYKTVRK